MIKNKPKKGDILIYVDSFNQIATRPEDLEMEIGQVVKSEFTGEKKVVAGIKKKICIVISDLVNELDKTQKELSELKISYRKNMKTLVNIIDVLTNQTELNNMQLNDLKTIKEEIKDEK